jgi:periplasmic copper chaperone A
MRRTLSLRARAGWWNVFVTSDIHPKARLSLDKLLWKLGYEPTFPLAARSRAQLGPMPRGVRLSPPRYSADAITFPAARRDPNPQTSEEDHPMHRLFTLAAAIALAAPVLAHEFVQGDLQIIHPYIPRPAASAKAAGGYMAIVNTGAEPDRLIGVESDLAAKSMLHESKVDASGLGTMEHVEALEIPPGQTVNLEHGGYHIMFMGLKGPLTEGEMHKAVLVFERAGRVEIEFQVDAPAGQDGHSHDGHSTN